MARIRSIKPEFFRHEALYEAEKATGLPLRLAFEGLWVVADKAGRFKWSPRVIKLDVLPYDDVDMEAVMDALAEHEFIQKYSDKGTEYGWIPSWSEHQRPNAREQESKIPAVDACVPVTVVSRTRNDLARARTCKKNKPEKYENPARGDRELEGKGKGKEVTVDASSRVDELAPLMTNRQEPFGRAATAPPVSGLVPASQLPKSPRQILTDAIYNDCLAANGNTFSNYPKERKGAKELARLCIARDSKDPWGFAQEIARTFHSLKASGDKFWRVQPFLPSTLASSGIFDRIIEAGRTAAVDTSADWLDDIEVAR